MLKQKLGANLLETLQNTKFFNFVNKLEAIQRLLMVVIFCMGVAIIVQSIVIYKLFNVSRTIVVPPKFDKEFWVSDAILSSSYYEQVGFYIADRVMSVSPKTAENSFDAILPFFGSNSKDIYPVKKMLKEQAEFIKKENIYQVFYPINVMPDIKEHKLMVNGTLRKFIGDLYIHDIDARVDIKFNVENGKFIIKNLEIK